MSADSPKSLSDIIAASGSAFRDLLTEAYASGHEAGFDAGYQAAISRVMGAVKLVATPPDGEPEARVITGEMRVTEGHDGAEMDVRAAPGTVKPAIEKLVKESAGITMQEIVERTGFKLNSVRGTLYTLKSEGSVDKWGEQWFPAKKDEQVLVEKIPEEFGDLREPKL